MHIVNLLYNIITLETATRDVLKVAIWIIQMSIVRLATRYVKHVLELPPTVLPATRLISLIELVFQNALKITFQQIKLACSVTIQFQLVLNLLPSIQQLELKTIKVSSICSSTKMLKFKATLLLSSLSTLK